MLGYRYPAQFQDHIFEGADGERIAASIALQEAARPGLIVVHGLFTSSRFDYVRQIAVRAYYEWGFNVAAIDLRSFGMTELTSPRPSTGGWKEGEDILALARYLKELGSTSVGALGISLGGVGVLGAAHPRRRRRDARRRHPRRLAPGDPERAWQRLSEPVPSSHPRYPLHAGFQAALISRVRSGRWPDGGRGHEPGDGGGLGALLRRHRPRRSGSVAAGWTTSTEAEGPAAGRSTPRTTRSSRSSMRACWRRPPRATTWCGSGSCPPGQHGVLEAIDRVWTYARLPGLLRALGDLRRAPGADAVRDAEVVYSASESG